MRKIVLFVIFLMGFILNPVFSYSKLDIKLDSIFSKKIDKVIEKKYKTKSTICTKKKYVYKKLIDRFKKLNLKKHRKILDYLINYTKKRELKIPECKINLSSSKDPIFHYILDKKLIIKDYKNAKKDYLKLDIEKKYYKLNDYDKIQYSSGKYLFKINDKWFLFKKYYSVVSSRKVPKEKGDLIFVQNHNKYIMVKKEDIIYFPYIDFKKSFEENKKFLSKKGIYYFNKFYFIKTNDTEKIPVGFLAEFNNRLVFFSTSNSFSYIELKSLTNHFFTILTKDKYKNTVLVKYKNKVFLYVKGFKLYDLGGINLYKNVDKQALGSILSHTFFIKTKSNIPYDRKNIYKLLYFAKNFNNKKLSFLYNYMKKNFKYNKKLQDIIWTKKYSEKSFNNYILNTPSLHKNWDVFYTFKNKEGVCQSLSDFLLLMSLFNGQKVKPILGKINYAHQVSKINNYYYDITSDLGKKTNNYFSMDEKKLASYFKIENSKTPGNSH